MSTYLFSHFHGITSHVSLETWEQVEQNPSPTSYCDSVKIEDFPRRQMKTEGAFSWCGGAWNAYPHEFGGYHEDVSNILERPTSVGSLQKKMILAVDSTDTNTETAGRIEAESGSQTERLIAYLGRRTAESPSTGDPQTHMMDKCGTQPTTLTRLVKREPQKAQLPAPHSQSWRNQRLQGKWRRRSKSRKKQTDPKAGHSCPSFGFSEGWDHHWSERGFDSELKY